MVIEAIEPVGGSVIVRGLAPDPQQPHELATRLARELDGLGWQIDSPSTRAARRGGRVAWAFDLGLAEPGADLARAGGGARPAARRPNQRAQQDSQTNTGLGGGW